MACRCPRRATATRLPEHLPDMRCSFRRECCRCAQCGSAPTEHGLAASAQRRPRRTSQAAIGGGRAPVVRWAVLGDFERLIRARDGGPILPAHSLIEHSRRYAHSTVLARWHGPRWRPGAHRRAQLPLPLHTLTVAAPGRSLHAYPTCPTLAAMVASGARQACGRQHDRWRRSDCGRSRHAPATARGSAHAAAASGPI